MASKRFYRGIRPDDLHGRMALANPERGFRTEMYFSEIPGEVAGTCSCHTKRSKLDGRAEMPVYQNAEIPGVPHLIRGNRLDGIEFSHGQWMDELDYFAYDGVRIMQSYCFLMNYAHAPLPPEKLADIERFFQKVRKAGVKLLLRFAYELSPSVDGPDKDTILLHLQQLTPLIRNYIDIIFVLQCGFVGKFGEWHNSFNHLQDDVAFEKVLLDAVLTVLPLGRCTMLRYPFLKQRVFDITPLLEEKAFTAAPEARIGHFNDGFLAGPSLGFGNHNKRLTIQEDSEYIAAESRFLPQDGELFWRDVAGPVLPTDALQYLRKWHYDTLGFVHSNEPFEGKFGYSMDVWKVVPVDPLFLKNIQYPPFSQDYFHDERGRFVWRSYYEFIRDHLGYRLELASAEILLQDGMLTANLELYNRGFSAPVNPRPILLTLENGKTKFDFPFDCEIRKLYGGEKHLLQLSAPLPDNWHSGVWQAGLALPDAAEVLRHDARYAIRLANAIEFRNGVNLLGEWEL